MIYTLVLKIFLDHLSILILLESVRYFDGAKTSSYVEVLKNPLMVYLFNDSASSEGESQRKK